MKLLLLLMFVLAGCTRPATLDLQMNSEADSLYEEACAHYENEEIDSCTYKLTKALELYRESGENEKVAILFVVGAILQWNSSDRFGKALFTGRTEIL